jgi:outer membrane protein assembly factor BamB
VNRDVLFTLTVFVMLLLPRPGQAGDWPTYGGDYTRSCVTDEVLTWPLHPSWVFQTRHKPRPAWPNPAPQDYWHRLSKLEPTMTFDRAFQVVGANGTIYFGTSADDQVMALEARTGRRLWSFTTEGPIRLAPTVHQDRLYVGSDDGRVYCLDAGDGTLIWQCYGAESRQVLPGNGRNMSLWPIRSGVVVDGGEVFFAAGLFPQQGAFLCSADADTGAIRWRQKITLSPQGHLLASDSRLYAPSGRTNPVAFDRLDGTSLGALPSSGGAYALLDRDVLIAGPGRGSQELVFSDIETRESVATLAGRHMLVAGGQAYVQSGQTLAALDRDRFLRLSRQRNKAGQLLKDLKKKVEQLPKEGDQADALRGRLQALASEITELSRQIKQCVRWKVPCDFPHALISVGDILFVGGADQVAAFHAQDGRVLWRAPVSGRAYDLSVIDGALFVSTDAGRIHCFRSHVAGPCQVIEPPIAAKPFVNDREQKRYRDAARAMVGNLGTTQGYCLILNCGQGQLAYELAQLTSLQIVGLAENPEDVTRARAALRQAGLYGRVVIHHRREKELFFAPYFANLVVLDGSLSGVKDSLSSEQIQRYTRPYGGAVVTALPANRLEQADLPTWGPLFAGGWQVHRGEDVALAWQRRGKLAGAGQWTHLYADASNTACSGDERVKGDMTVQWFGKPGAGRMIDRHHRNVPPLFCNGILYVPGDRIVYAVDAYNGFPLWDIEIPNSRRLGVFLDSGSMAVDEERLYIAAEDKCYAYDARDGRQHFVHTLPPQVNPASSYWGYLANSDGVLLGSVCRQEASYRLTSYDADNALWYRNMEVVTSRTLFAMDKNSNQPLWTYDDGLILNTTITVGEGHVYFVTTDNPEALANRKGRMPVKLLFAGGQQTLVALDLYTGKLLYKKPIDVRNFEEPVYLNYAENTVLLSGSRLQREVVHYYYQAYDAPTGAIRWQADHDTDLAADGGHGEYNRHPTLVGDTVYAWPFAYGIADGQRVPDWQFNRQGHGCGGVSASAQSLFWRGGNPWMYDLSEEGGAQRLNAVSRPGCWINMIPAGGLLLIPEASSGCTCAFPMQTSMALIPR